jgi:hypothetical protein
MWRSLLLGKISISVAISSIIGAYGFWQLSTGKIPEEEYSSWLGVACFFSALAAVQLVLVVLMFRKKKLD